LSAVAGIADADLGSLFVTGYLPVDNCREFCDTAAMKKKIPSIPIVLTILFFGLLPIAHAVSPPPDGGYPGGNTAEGQNALLSLTSGGFNTAVGLLSLRSNATGQLNTATGAGTLLANTADENTAIGAGALFSNTVGTQNTATGAFVLFLNTTGARNTASGFEALFSNTTGSFNTANGLGALDLNTVGNSNTAIGTSAMQANTTGSNNTAIGELALEQNTTGNRNIALGLDAGIDVTTASDVICIGASGANVNNSCYIGQIFNATSANGIPVLINSSNKLGTTTSSKRFKENIKPMDKVSEELLALKPVSFRYKKEIDPAGISQFGLVAEDVEKVNPDLVVRDKEGKAYSVRYDQVNAMLLNEFLKEHRKVEKLEAAIARQQKGIDALVAHIKEQDSKIQKVSDPVEIIKAAAQMAAYR
jgi:hypothetical protein